MKIFRKILLAALALGLCLPGVVWGRPSVESVEVPPNSQLSGQGSPIVVAASSDDTEETSTTNPGPGPASASDSTSSSRQWLEVEIKPVSQGVVLTWFAPEGVACQVQTSTDLINWNDVGPILAGTNGWVSVMMPTAEGQEASSGPPALDAGLPTKASFFRVKDVAAPPWPQRRSRKRRLPDPRRPQRRRKEK